ncbi:MAG: glycosyltransferase [Ignavibacteria bacterium]|nr:glycosyltransferase [Ignavibacteria bacterium]
MNQPLVTVFSLVYNTNPKFSIEAINSIYSQTYKNIEHIIINDSPDDNIHWPLIKKYIIENDLPSVILENKQNKGICSNLNHILKIANGKYILGCSDDIIKKDRVYNDVLMLESSSENTALVFSQVEYIDEHSKTLKTIKPLNYNSDVSDLLSYFFFKNHIPAPSVTMKTELVLKCGGFNTEFEIEDYELWLRLISKGFTFIFRNKVDTHYRIHNLSLSRKFKEKLEFNTVRLLIQFSTTVYHKTILKMCLLKYRINDNLINELFSLYKSKYSDKLIFYIIKYRKIRFVSILSVFYYKYLKYKELKLRDF